MHICFICNEYPKAGYAHGGLGSFVKTIAPKLVQNGIRVSVVGMNYTAAYGEEQENGATIYRLPQQNIKGISWLLNNIKLNKKINEIHSRDPIDIVESPELGLAFIQKNPAIKYVIRLHGGHHFFAEAENRGINWWKGFQEKRSFLKADAFIAVSKYVQVHTAKFLSYNNRQVSLIHYPVDTELFSPMAISPTDYKIVFAGTVCEKKGVRQLIEAFPTVKSQFPLARLHIYGRDWFFPDGSSYIKMMQLLIADKMPEYTSDIIFEGAVSHNDIPRIYASAAVCVFPSHMETQGLVAPEAMAMEKAVVFTNLGPGPETIVDGQTGWLCNPRDPANIAAKIGEVLVNQHRAAEVGQQARTFVQQQYGLQRIIAQNIEFYKSLL